LFLRAPRRLWASAAMLKTVQLRVEGPVAFTGSFERRDALWRARRCSRRFNSVSRALWRSLVPSCAATPLGERGDAQSCRFQISRRFNSVSKTPWRSRTPSCAATPLSERCDARDGSTPCLGPLGARELLRAPRRLTASAAMLKTVQLRVEDSVALTGSFVRRDAFRRARRCSRRFNSVSRMPWRSRAPSCAATLFGERGDA